MRSLLWPSLSLFLSLLNTVRAASPQTATTTAQPPQRDPQAVAILQQSVAAMASNVPTDSSATGTVAIVAGSDSDKGTIRILTRGTDQSREEIQTTLATQSTIYSKGLAGQQNGVTTNASPMELAVTSQTAYFPLPLLTGIANDPDEALVYVGLETIDAKSFHHIRSLKTFGSNPRLKLVAEFSARNIWIDSATGLPGSLSYVRRDAAGPSPGIPVEVTYADYRNVGGAHFPFLIRVSLNGTPWATIAIDTVALNTGLSDADFAIQ